MDIYFEKVKTNMAKLKNRRVPGLDEVTNKFKECRGEHQAEELICLYKKYTKQSSYPRNGIPALLENYTKEDLDKNGKNLCMKTQRKHTHT